MTSLENGESIQSPRKRQKLEPSSPTTTSQLLDTPQLNTINSDSALNNNPDIAMENSEQKQQDPVSNSSQPDREAEAGILHYVNKSNPGFQGVLKHRYVCFDILCPFLLSTISLEWLGRRLMKNPLRCPVQQPGRGPGSVFVSDLSIAELPSSFTQIFILTFLTDRFRVLQLSSGHMSVS
jgi:hypothetical protein